jgi:hypothetical protein
MKPSNLSKKNFSILLKLISGVPFMVRRKGEKKFQQKFLGKKYLEEKDWRSFFRSSSDSGGQFGPMGRMGRTGRMGSLTSLLVGREELHVRLHGLEQPLLVDEGDEDDGLPVLGPIL